MRLKTTTFPYKIPKAKIFHKLHSEYFIHVKIDFNQTGILSPEQYDCTAIKHSSTLTMNRTAQQYKGLHF